MLLVEAAKVNVRKVAARTMCAVGILQLISVVSGVTQAVTQRGLECRLQSKQTRRLVGWMQQTVH